MISCHFFYFAVLILTLMNRPQILFITTNEQVQCETVNGLNELKQCIGYSFLESLEEEMHFYWAPRN